MSKRLGWVALFAILIVSVLVILAGGLYFLGADRLIAGPPPTLVLLQPSETLAVHSGDSVLIFVQAQSDRGIARVDLLINDDVVASHTPEQTGAMTFLTSFNWFASEVGEHAFRAIAYDDAGQPSEPVALTIAVHPRAVAQRNGLPDNLPAGSIEPVAHDLPNAAEAADGGQGAGDGAQAGDDNNAEGQAAQNELPPLAEQVPDVNDNAPSIEFFDYDLELVNGGFEAALMVIAQDDLGIDTLEFTVASTGAGPTTTYNHDCGGQAVCEIGTRAPLAAGEWLLGVQAFDTSGQASEPELLIAEVLGEEGQPPAAAEHDEAWADWFADQFADVANPQFNIDLDLLRPNFDFTQFLDLFGNQNAEEDAQGVDSECSIAVSGSSTPDQNTVSFRIERCPALVAPDGQIIYAHISKYLLFQQDGGILLHIPDWYDEGRTRMALGEELTWVDHNVVCGMTYEYTVLLDFGIVREPGRNSSAAVGVQSNVAYSTIVLEPTLGCPAGDPGNVDLNAELDDQNTMQISWQFPDDPNWPQEPPIDNGLSIRLLRFSPFFDEQVVLFDEVRTVEQIAAQPAFAMSDADLVCNNQYWYTLEVISADADLGLVSPGWIVRQPVQAPIVACDNSRLDDWFDVSTFRTERGELRALMEITIPDNVQLPPGDNIELWLEYTVDGEGCESPPCDGPYRNFRRLHARNGQFAANVYEEGFGLRCGDKTYLARIALVADGVGVEYSNTVAIQNDRCPPPTPHIVSVFATTNECPNNVERCVIVEWERYQQPRNQNIFYPAVQLFVQRTNLNLNNVTDFPVAMDSTTFVDTNPLHFNESAQPGFQCEVPVMYRIYAIDANGRFYGYSPLSLYNLRCDQPWNEYREAR